MSTPAPPPPPPPDTTPPLITVPPAAGSVGETSASITWRTDEASDSVVQYGVNSTSWGNYGNTKTSASLVTSHSIALNGLSAGTTYYYRVRSSDAAGNAVTSGEFSFTTDEDTAPPPPPSDTTPPVITVQPSAGSVGENSCHHIVGYKRSQRQCGAIRCQQHELGKLRQHKNVFKSCHQPQHCAKQPVSGYDLLLSGSGPAMRPEMP